MRRSSRARRARRDTLVKLISAAGFQLKGSGWYATDFKGSGSKPAPKKEGDDEAPRASPKRQERGQGRRQERVEGAKAKSEAKSDAKGRGHGSGDRHRSRPCLHVTRRRAVANDEALPDRRTARLGAARHHDLGAAFLVTTLDQTLLLVPENLRPEALFGFHIPGLGVVLSFAILLVTGVIAANFFGQRLIRIWEGILGRIPFVKSIYSSVKQVSDTVLSDQGTAFRKALLVEFPRPGCWTIAFLTGTPADAVADHLRGEYVSVYVPTTPNPTGGYFVMVPKDRRPRARHVGRRRAQVHHLDGRRRSASPRSGTGGRDARGARAAARSRRSALPEIDRRGRRCRRRVAGAAARAPAPLPRKPTPATLPNATPAGERIETHRLLRTHRPPPSRARPSR